MIWPNDVDGDVFRKLQSRGFDFTKECDIDFNVDFDSWPPLAEAIDLVKSRYENVEAVNPDTAETENGYITFQIHAKLTYDLVMQVQAEVTQVMERYQGRCESWGVWGNTQDA